MDRKELDSLRVKKEDSESVVVSVRIPKRVKAALEARGDDISKTVRNVLLRLADK